jgi:hypothetical protein
MLRTPGASATRRHSLRLLKVVLGVESRKHPENGRFESANGCLESDF